MTINVSVSEAEAKISELFQRIRKGEEVIILENGYELARVIPSNQPKAPRIPGIDEGKIVFAPNFEDPLPIEIRHVFQLWTLAEHHRDPFDRILIAQSQVEQLPIVTSDQTIPKYPVQVIW